MDRFIDMCIEALKAGITMETGGLYIYCIGNDYYIEGGHYIEEKSIRRWLTQYYIGNSSAMEMDKEWLIHRLSTVSTGAMS